MFISYDDSNSIHQKAHIKNNIIPTQKNDQSHMKKRDTFPETKNLYECLARIYIWITDAPEN